MLPKICRLYFLCFSHCVVGSTEGFVLVQGLFFLVSAVQHQNSHYLCPSASSSTSFLHRSLEPCSFGICWILCSFFFRKISSTCIYFSVVFFPVQRVAGHLFAHSLKTFLHRFSSRVDYFLWTFFTSAATCYVSEALEYRPRNCVMEFSVAFRCCTHLTSTAGFFLESLYKSLARCVSVAVIPCLVSTPSYPKNVTFSHLFLYSLSAELSTIMSLCIGVEDFFSSQIARLRFLPSCYVLQSEAPKKNSSFNCCNLLGIEDMKL